jgi:thiopurine S-methyltransferase
MHPDYWLESWQRDHKPFHQTRINTHLQTFWPRLDPGPGSRVFVPLCGQSLDLLWLESRDRDVLGIELAPEPLSALFAGIGRKPEISPAPPFRVWKSGKLELLQGNFFSVDPDRLADCGAWYDRAALPALPEELRREYAAHATHLAPPGCRMLLITPEYDPAEMSGPPFSITDSEVRDRFAAGWSVECLVDGEVPVAGRFSQRGLTRLRERVHFLERRPTGS